MIQLLVHAKDLERGLQSHVEDRFEQIAFIVEEEGEKAALRVRAEGFSPEGGGDTLKIRSGAAFNSIGSEFERRSPTELVTRFGAVYADPETLMHLTVQEGGMVITPRLAEKLAFPPYDAGDPVRDDVTGVQLLWATEFTERAEEFGFDFVKWTDRAVLARREGEEDFQVMFIRADAVEIPARQIVHKQYDQTVEAIKRRIANEA